MGRNGSKAKLRPKKKIKNKNRNIHTNTIASTIVKQQNIISIIIMYNAKFILEIPSTQGFMYMLNAIHFIMTDRHQNKSDTSDRYVPTIHCELEAMLLNC